MGQFEAANAQVLGVSTDHLGSHRAFASHCGARYPLLSDFYPHGEVARAYGVFNEASGTARRSTFIIDKSGIIRYKKVHEAGTLPDPDELLAELRKLQ